MRTSKIQTSLRIRADWLGPSLFAIHIPQDLKSEGIWHAAARTNLTVRYLYNGMMLIFLTAA